MSNSSRQALPWAFFIYHPLYFKFQSCYQQCKTRSKKYVLDPHFYKIFTGFVHRSVSDASVKKIT
ncbi:hypothetical protein P7631_46 [Streptococcus phage P7631]|uniref:Uncharacterized protein n=1 Tax=Streptococcus phage P7631 TaxID=1971433 RepID=A0A286QQ90_9CAUD|nr:hypothetical protein PP243_gp46 [Streptococcus phage P7631]ARU14089.1 hypothetical protein P7631_46 [Streptococcus phage P7631]